MRKSKFTESQIMSILAKATRGCQLGRSVASMGSAVLRTTSGAASSRGCRWQSSSESRNLRPRTRGSSACTQTWRLRTRRSRCHRPLNNPQFGPLKFPQFDPSFEAGLQPGFERPHPPARWLELQEAYGEAMLELRAREVKKNVIPCNYGVQLRTFLT